jgi:preprotein translocase subunit SecE
MNIGLIIGALFGVGLLVVVIVNLEKIRKFVAEVVIELKKVSWSTKRELIDSTIIVLTSTAILGVFIGSTDFVLSKIIGFIIK